MFTEAIYGESFVRSLSCRDILLETVLLPETIWCGALGYATHGTDGPNVPALLEQYRALCAVPKRETPMHAWTACIRIEPDRPGAPRGVLFAQQVMTVRQDASHDIYVLPPAMCLRAAACAGTFRALLDREEAEPAALFAPLRALLPALGYAPAENGEQAMTVTHADTGETYVYVPVTPA